MACLRVLPIRWRTSETVTPSGCLGEHVGEQPSCGIESLRRETDTVDHFDLPLTHELAQLGSVDTIGVGWSESSGTERVDEGMPGERIGGLGDPCSPPDDRNFGQQFERRLLSFVERSRVETKCSTLFDSFSHRSDRRL